MRVSPNTSQKRSDPQVTGHEGERIAERFLVRKNYRVIDRRWSCRTGEIDLVALDGNEVVFVEVKCRAKKGFGRPEDAVTRAKRDRIRSAAEHYLLRRAWGDVPYRIDVITVERSGRSHTVRHLISAVDEQG